ncbi:YABBY domain-containing protein [Cephalotus follicularis]|uniref:YABBY domain-containing protein n=1 Tax=Cephalotus follicularis TaxID=3775 RepID=A0A1Q3B7Z8_CEPFO|nr:YABBY domain-containing protein [Cephalotus follicularis]
MSLDLASERVCYVHCNFCNTILAVSVPCTIMFNAVTVRCGHCANLMSLTIGALLQTVHLQNLHKQSLYSKGLSESSSKCNNVSILDSVNDARTLFPSAMEKKQRIPSAYNRFIKEEIRRIKANNPDITHREAFSTAAKNWAHLPHINFGLKLDHGGQN